MDEETTKTAFPILTKYSIISRGMTLRDYFAGQVVTTSGFGWGIEGDDYYQRAAATAYRLAAAAYAAAAAASDADAAASYADAASAYADAASAYARTEIKAKCEAWIQKRLSEKTPITGGKGK